MLTHEISSKQNRYATYNGFPLVNESAFMIAEWFSNSLAFEQIGSVSDSNVSLKKTTAVATYWCIDVICK